MVIALASIESLVWCGNAMIRMILVDDHTLVRTALMHLIQPAGDGKIVAKVKMSAV